MSTEEEMDGKDRHTGDDGNPEAENGAEENSGKQEESASPEGEDAGYKDLNDKYVRLYAEFDNYRRRANKERIETILQGNKDLLLRLIPVVDDFDRAIASIEKAEDVKALKEGVMLIYNKLKNVLQQAGLKEIESRGEPFDPELHDAITQVPAPTPDMKGKVMDEVEKGYYLNDKIIRHARVVVGE